ncbi:phosphoenolpyruvate--protein phosphotransferase [Pseudonocardia spinosispora]|uniref:phosphoenolpyruvate--protein phosphotransferase n=1 Tax=Pseudonocardia spinosispora TaxID=103441 RepID=UPI0004034E21|nr:phosphoenolpyruvate--protein phosphotransferase [Pseudonocardia spinosispora]
MSDAALLGRGVSPGGVCARLARLAPPPATSADDPVGEDVRTELARANQALDDVAALLEERAAKAEGVAAEVLVTTAAMAADPTLRDAVAEQLNQGRPTAHAVTLAVEGFCAQLRAIGGYLAERVTDLRDVAARAAALLLGVDMPGIPSPGHPIVLTAVDLAPADTATLPGSDVVALVTEQGGPTGHTAILAKSLGLPAIVACPAIASVPAGTWVLVDGSTGTVEVDPSREARARVHAVKRPEGEPGPGRTRDGSPVALLSNIGTTADASRAAASGTEGVGLFRTEFLFLDRRTAPTEAEQTETYASVLAGFGERPVVVRTLDAGSDKPLPFLPLGVEQNPALGVRGLRTSALHPDALETQLRALASAARDTGRPARVMAPMVATADEARRFVELAHAHGLAEAGVMIEVPAAALRAEEILRVVDFVSIGTNDLGQYVMAADRTSGALAELLDPWQPALLDLIALVGRAGALHSTPVGVCGEAAGDPLLAAVLVGLGATSLSMAPLSRAGVHAELAALSRPDCRAIADAALAGTGPADARARALGVRERVGG